MNALEQKAKAIKLLICDVDGVLTDGNLYYTGDGFASSSFYVQDGLGLVLLQHAGLHVSIITTSTSNIIKTRAQGLGIKHVYLGQRNKLPAFLDLLDTLSLDKTQAAYIGDDLPDLVVMERCGLSVAPANAVPRVKECADHITQHAGGHGAVREVCDLILQAQNLQATALKHFVDSKSS